MVRISICSYCKYVKRQKGGIMKCKAFPNGQPRGFKENINEICNNGIKFEVDQEYEQEFNSFFK